MSEISILRPTNGRVKHGERHLTADYSHDIHDVIVTWYETSDNDSYTSGTGDGYSGDIGRSGATIVAEIAFPRGSDITPSDRVEIEGDVYRIVGKIANPRNDLSGTVFRSRAKLANFEG